MTKEHIPAKGSYKGRPYRVEVWSGDKVLEGGRGRIYQRGFHSEVLCADCNNITGAWYGDEFATWSRWGFKLLDAMRDGIPRVSAYEGYPSRIAKQVISTMIASAQKGFADEQPMLRSFVLERERTLAEGSVRLATYLCPTRTGRTTGVCCAMKPPAPPHVLIEFALPPFGYVLTLSGEPLDPRPVSISWFATCGVDEHRVIDLPHIPVLPTHEALPGDYRTRDEIRRDVIVNVLIKENHPSPEQEAERILGNGEGPAFFTAHAVAWSWDSTGGLM